MTRIGPLAGNNFTWAFGYNTFVIRIGPSAGRNPSMRRVRPSAKFNGYVRKVGP